ncbi:MAG TPA: hypothetical protein VEI28_06050 [Thermodesulfovibrionales bacterium]|nr:hypothetical protein [Thermodesulfovibrionales bacterium]
MRRFILPSGPLLSLALIGILILSALLYYRSVKIQRFLEPALAISQPRMKFSQNINSLLVKEFGTGQITGLRFRTGSILVEPSLLLTNIHPVKGAEPVILKKLARVFLTALNDPEVRDYISLILVGTRIPLHSHTEANKEMRAQMQERAGLILSSLFALEPRLENTYGGYFAATALTVEAGTKETGWIEFRIVPTERLHIEVLLRLGKYAQ